MQILPPALLFGLTYCNLQESRWLCKGHFLENAIRKPITYEPHEGGGGGALDATCVPREPVGQVREARVREQRRALHVDFGGLQPELLQLVREHAELFALTPALVLQLSHLGLKRYNAMHRCLGIDR